MIRDTLDNAFAYTSLRPLFAKALNYLKENNFATFTDGTMAIEEGLKMIVSAKKGKTKKGGLVKFECHDKYFDIQFCAKGIIETIAWKPLEKCNISNGAYNREKDVRFFNDEQDTFFQLTDNQFVIFFPQKHSCVKDWRQ